jgi:hypothetical protein
MPNNSVRYNISSGGNVALEVTTNSSLEISHTDSYIFGGWIHLDSGNANILDLLIFGKGGALTASTSYYLKTRGTGSVAYVKVAVRDTSSSIVSLESTGTIGELVNVFVLAWVDANLGTLNLQINNGSPESVPITLTSFTDPGSPLRLFQTYDGLNWFSRFARDSWFFCKNPPNMADAIDIINNYVYNSGFGVSYASLSTTMKTTMGLESWWDFDETGINNRLDSHGSSDFTYLGGNLEETTAITSGSILYASLSDIITASSNENSVQQYVRDYVETLNIADSISKTAVLAAMLEAISLSDTEVVSLNKILQEFLFLSDVVRTSPLLKFNSESVKLADWLIIKRNPPVPQWHD